MSESDFINTLRKMIKSNSKIYLELFEVIKYDEVQRIIEIKRPYEKTSYTNVIISSVGLGDNRGVSIGYEVGDYVLVYDMSGQFVIVNSVHNVFFPGQKDTEIWPKPKEIIIQSSSLGRIKLQNDSGFKIMQKDGYGIQCDKDGNIVINAKTFELKNVSGTW